MIYRVATSNLLTYYSLMPGQIACKKYLRVSSHTLLSLCKLKRCSLLAFPHLKKAERTNRIRPCRIPPAAQIKILLSSSVFPLLPPAPQTERFITLPGNNDTVHPTFLLKMPDLQCGAVENASKFSMQINLKYHNKIYIFRG